MIVTDYIDDSEDSGNIEDSLCEIKVEFDHKSACTIYSFIPLLRLIGSILIIVGLMLTFIGQKI